MLLINAQTALYLNRLLYVMSITVGRCCVPKASKLSWQWKRLNTTKQSPQAAGPSTRVPLDDAMFFQDSYLLPFARKDNVVYHGSQFTPHFLGENVCNPSQPCFLPKPAPRNPEPCSQALRSGAGFPCNPHPVFQPSSTKAGPSGETVSFRVSYI